MRLFALGDPHLSFDRDGNEYKPMGVFGEGWENHGHRLQENWLSAVKEEDVVLLPGDISWAMTLEEFQPDLEFLSQLPGRKIIIKGNHDLWWDSLSKMRNLLPPGFAVLQNDSIVLADRLAICGTRGWQSPDQDFLDPHDAKIFQRELNRLKLSLDSVPPGVTEKLVMLHYPPVNYKLEKGPFIEMMQQYGVQICIYGHLHSYAIKNRLPEEQWGIRFHLVSADFLQFWPKLIMECS